MPIFVVARAIPMVRMNGPPDRPGHSAPLGLLAVNAAGEAVILHERLIRRRPIGGIGPDATRRIGLIEQSFTQPGALVGGRNGCRPFANEAEAAVDRDMMEWLPPPDGIAMCQGGDLRIPRME